jgi:hypothetical protein
MPRKEPARSHRSPFRRRLETAMHAVALTFFTVLGFAIYQNVSHGKPTASEPSAFGPVEARPNSVGPSEQRPREGELAAASPKETAPATAPPAETKPIEEEPATTGSSKPAPGNVPASGAKQDEERPSTPAPIKPEPKAALLSPASLACAAGSPTSWEFANVELIDSISSRVSSRVASCRISPVTDGPVPCQSAIIVGVGVASSKGINETENARALRRGINLASALKKDLQTRCNTSVAVSAYVLNLGRYSDEHQRDEPDQRKVIALVATGADAGDEAAADAVAAYTKNDPMIVHYPICQLYKLDGAGQPTPVLAQHNICGDQSGSTVSQR